jgi:hypothetical protein
VRASKNQYGAFTTSQGGLVLAKDREQDYLKPRRIIPNLVVDHAPVAMPLRSYNGSALCFPGEYLPTKVLTENLRAVFSELI